MTHMELGIMMAWEIGCFMLPFTTENPPLTIAFWLTLLLGFGIQYLLLSKARRRWLRRSFIALLVPCLLLGELSCQVITGWDLLVCIVLYFGVITLFTGALLATLLHRLRAPRRGQQP